MSPVVGTRAMRATAKTSSVSASIFQMPVDRQPWPQRDQTAGGSPRAAVGSLASFRRATLAYPSSSVPPSGIGGHRTPQVIIDRVFVMPESGIGWSSDSIRVHSDLLIPRSASWLRLVLLH